MNAVSIGFQVPFLIASLFSIMALHLRAVAMSASSSLVFFFLSPVSRPSMVFSRIYKSFAVNSLTIISISRSGLTSPSSWITSGSENARTTWKIPSVALISARKLFPRPAPVLAPLTRPAISKIVRAEGTLLLG